MTAKREAPCTAATGKGAKVELHTVEKNTTKPRTGQALAPRRFRDSHLETWSNDLHFRQFGSSVERIEEVDRLLDKTEKALKPCPFCGGNAMLEGTFCFYKPAVVASCQHCHNGTILFTQGEKLASGHFDTLEDAIEKAVKRWNARKGGGAV